MVELQFNRRSFARAYLSINAVAKKLIIRKGAPRRTTRKLAIKRQLQSIENRRLAGSIQPPNQNDRLAGTRRQNNLLPPTIQTEIMKY
jgi:hypothetical protein